MEYGSWVSELLSLTLNDILLQSGGPLFTCNSYPGTRFLGKQRCVSIFLCKSLCCFCFYFSMQALHFTSAFLKELYYFQARLVLPVLRARQLVHHHRSRQSVYSHKHLNESRGHCNCVQIHLLPLSLLGKEIKERKPASAQNLKWNFYLLPPLTSLWIFPQSPIGLSSRLRLSTPRPSVSGGAQLP